MIGAANIRILAFGALCAFGMSGPAYANPHHASHGFGVGARPGHGAGFVSFGRGGHGRFAELGSWTRAGRMRHFASHGHSGGGIQCVTFARADTGIELEGNANTWWEHAVGLYQRGNAPEPGSVLNFRANGAMRLGHVAVVNEVINSRTVMVDHANWGGPGGGAGAISRQVPVVDVSPANDWTAVRVALGHSGDFGSIYPTFGFIYNRPDRGVMVASAPSSAAMPALNPAPRDLRPSARYDADEEVAEAPDLEGRSYAYYGGRFSRFGHHHRSMSRLAVSHAFGHAPSVRFAAYHGASGHAAAPARTSVYRPQHRRH